MSTVSRVKLYINSERERERERERQRQNKTVNTRRMLGTSPRFRYVVTANSIKVFKF
jgi:hypothetical protein